MSQLTEQEVRDMRARVFGECSDGNWNACKANWMRAENVEWLKEALNNPSTNQPSGLLANK